MNRQDFIAILGLLFGVVGFIYGFLKDIDNKKLTIQMRKNDERLKANEMYDKIRNRREVFEDCLGDLLCIDEKADINVRKNNFIKTSQKYTNLYNEIEDFCNKSLDNAIKSENYITTTILPILSDLAERQIEIYKLLNDYAIKYSFNILGKPDFKAFEKYDQFLIQHNGGESAHFWKKIKNMRREAGFE